MRARPLNLSTIGRAAGFVLVAGAIVATAISFHRDDSRQNAPAISPAIQSDPLARELARCQTIGMVAQTDGSCEAAWAENRRRFFTYRPAPSAASTPPANPRLAPTSKDQ
ncbi:MULTISPECIES: putative entry exclusion protein TrbK-alt [Acidiphilium]|uniref:putative entry exclusion protein TrbK-alt n=1 Tax=Acidiphilium TaxID=522 RepID=UPI002589ADA7|nr:MULTISPECIES: putative entry exclusion protein TrbK-alt [Acidiphilium]HQT85084.1 putative entry exclusion protein TrbK-alt [Acidiphilium rubrum]